MVSQAWFIVYISSEFAAIFFILNICTIKITAEHKNTTKSSILAQIKSLGVKHRRLDKQRFENVMMLVIISSNASSTAMLANNII